MYRKWATLALLLLFAPVLAMAQNTGKLAGRVIDKSTGEPLPGASVVLLGTQLGAITDENGQYFIIGIPVGTYDVQASFVGYRPVVVRGVEINAGYTRELNFELEPTTVELEEVVVTYERPLIQKDAIGVPKVVTAEQIQNLPVRGVANVAALQGGVIKDEGSSALYIRGGREQEVVYYVDGVKVIGALGVPQQAIQEQEMLIGGLPAKYGDAMSGVISITTKTGAPRFYGSVEGITSEALDDYGYNLGSFSLGGPIVKNKLTFFVATEYRSNKDRNPRAIPVPQLSDGLLEQIQNNPQVISFLDENGNVQWVPLPGDLPAGTSLDDALARMNIPEGWTLNSPTPKYAPETFLEDKFYMANAKPHYKSRNFSLTGNVTFNPTKDIRLRIGGTHAQNYWQSYSQLRVLYNADRFNDNDSRTNRLFAAWTHYLSKSTFYQVNVSFEDYKSWSYDPNFSRNIEDILFYGDIDHPANAVAARYKNYDPATGTYVNAFSDGNLPRSTFIYSVQSPPGAVAMSYSKTHNQQFRISANATTQLGLHLLEFGGEYEQRIRRYYINFGKYGQGAAYLAGYYNDGNVEAEVGVDSYDQLPFSALNEAIWYYGYNYLGTKEVNDQDIEGFVNGTNYNMAPHRPIYYAGYIQDKIEYKDIVLNLGLRVDVFDNNTLVLKDEYALVPIIRVKDIRGQVNVPSNIGDDFAVYYSGDNVVGFRDLDGNFYDINGQRVDPQEIANIARPKIPEGKPRRISPEVFTDYKPQVTVMPRIGVSFPITDQALFFAHYDVLSMRPTENSFDTIYEFNLAAQQTRTIENPNLKPEKTIEYELGFRQRLGARAALTISGFYRQIKNKIQLRTVNYAFPNGYTTYRNVDFGTVKGLEFEFDLRRTANVSLNANYTLQWAKGTGSDSRTTAQIAWRGQYFPDFIFPLDFDQRHTINLTLDYRLGEDQGPEIFGAKVFENFGVNVVTQLASGHPYTPLKGPNPIFNAFILGPKGELNSAYMPWRSLINLRVDRRFKITKSASLTAYLWIQNLLDTDNVLNVYRATGLPDNDGWLETTEGQDWLNNQTVPESAKMHYQYRVRSPFNYGIPRMTRLGFRIDF